MKWNGTAWTQQKSGISQFLNKVWGADANNVWAVGERGIVMKCEVAG